MRTTCAADTKQPLRWSSLVQRDAGSGADQGLRGALGLGAQGGKRREKHGDGAAVSRQSYKCHYAFLVAAGLVCAESRAEPLSCIYPSIYHATGIPW